MRSRGPKPLTPIVQLLLLRAASNGSGHGDLRRGRLTWDFDARPSPLSRDYRLRISYQLGRLPRVYAIRPHLPTLVQGKTLPHVYQQDPTRLCLFLPRSGEWSPAMKISDTIVPWSVLWLFYFEDWLTTGEWSGGGMHPPKRRARA